jgi:hypothetical protein
MKIASTDANEPPRDAADLQARYIGAAVNGVLIASIYLPNGILSLVQSQITSSYERGPVAC